MKAAALALALLVFQAGGRGETLGVAGSRFTVNGQPKFLLFVSYFDGLRRANAGDLDADFAYLKRIGYDGIRLMVNWRYACGSGPVDDGQKLFAADGSLNKAMWPVFVRLLERAADHRLLVDVTFTRDTYATPIPIDAYRKGIATVAERLAAGSGYRHALFDVHNEYPVHGLKPSEIHEILTAVAAVDPARIITASGGGGDIVDDPAMDVVAYHDSREDDWFEPAAAARQMEAVRRGMGPAEKPIYLQEPMPFRKFHPDCGHGEWPRAGAARRAVAHARQNGAAAWTFHTRQSFDLRRRTLVEILEDDPEQKAEIEAVSAASGSASGG